MVPYRRKIAPPGSRLMFLAQALENIPHLFPEFWLYNEAGIRHGQAQKACTIPAHKTDMA